MSKSSVTNIIIAGLGGQGVLKASDIVADAAFRTGADVKKAEVHGMSQRGGSVSSDIRFGEEVLSPMVPPGAADYLVVLSPGQVDNNRWQLRPGGVLITPGQIEEGKLKNKKSINVALLGILSAHLEIGAEVWREAICSGLPAKLHAVNLDAFALGRETAGGGQ
ncbi:MAG: indolepyruvate oxidoreductase subunit beta [Acidobacteria bacterium]|nr:indolepyruvate oxidoreductase subunit beta [Acidobacteriota bacterium]